MSDEIVKMKRAKMYVDYLISGVDPVDKENIDLEIQRYWNEIYISWRIKHHVPI